MSYAKAIMYGDTLEIYEYEKKPPPHVRGLRKKDRPKLDEDKKFEKRKDNVLQAKRNFRRLVGANLSSKPLLISFTYNVFMGDITTGYRDYKSFVQALRYRFGKDLKYIAVPEFQKSGRVHFHALFWGLPNKIASQERRTRLIAKMWGKGFVDIIETDGHGKISSYLAKYMAKAFVDKHLKNQKAYVSSRNIDRPVVDKNAIVSMYLFQFTKDGDLPIMDNSYKTKWTGQCRHRLFKTSQQNIE